MILFYDFYYFFTAFKLALADQNIYDHSVFAQEIYRQGFLLGEGVPPFPYPPFVLLFLSLFVVADVYSSVLNLSLFSISIYLIAVIVFLKDGKRSSGTSISLPIIIAIIFFYPILKIIIWGQISMVLFLCFIIFLFCKKKNLNFLGGNALSVLIIKPHLFSLVFFAIFIDIIKDRNYKLAFGFLFGLLLQAVFTELYFPGQIANYFYSVADFMQVHQCIGASLSSLLGKFICCKWSFVPLQVAGALIIMYNLVKLRKKFINEFYWILTLSIVLSPYAWSHDFIFILPLYIHLLLNKIIDVQKIVLLLSIILICILLLLLDLRPNLNTYTAFYPLCCLIILYRQRGILSVQKLGFNF